MAALDGELGYWILIIRVRVGRLNISTSPPRVHMVTIVLLQTIELIGFMNDKVSTMSKFCWVEDELIIWRSLGASESTTKTKLDSR